MKRRWRLIVGLIVVIAVLLAALPFWLIGKRKCVAQGHSLKLPFQYGFSGCRVEYRPGQWVPVDQLPAVEIDPEINRWH